MYRPRIIPVLLLKNDGLVKSVKFNNHRYIGDPINAVRIFNDLRADELAFLDITATSEKRCISTNIIKNVGEEANMPFSAGGGIRTLGDIQKLVEAGAEKVIINSYAAENPGFINEAANEFGSSTIAVCIDVKRNFLNQNKSWIKCGNKSTKYSPSEFAKMMETAGAGELIIQSIEKDGTMSGYNIDLITEISISVKIPITALGGAGNLLHMKELLNRTVVNGLGAGSLFIYHGTRNAILINYPDYNEIIKTVN